MTELTPVPDDAQPLPDGGWVVLRDHSGLRQRDREAFLDELPDISTMPAMKAGLATFTALIAYAVTAWSYDMPVPSEDPNSVGDLSIAGYDAIRELVAPFRAAFFPDMSNPGDGTDRTTPTGPSNA